MDIGNIKKVIRQHWLVLQSEYGVEKLGIFGSYVRNEATEESDIDILVDLARPTGLFKFIEIESSLRNSPVKRLTLSPGKR